MTAAATTVAVSRPPEAGVRRVARWLAGNLRWIYVGRVVLYLVIPIDVIAMFSFTDPVSRSNLVWHGFALRSWLNPLGVPRLGDGLAVSLRIALASTVI